MKTKKLTFKVGKLLLIGGVIATSIGCDQRLATNPAYVPDDTSIENDTSKITTNPAYVPDTSKDTSVKKDMGNDTVEDVISQDLASDGSDADSSD